MLPERAAGAACAAPSARSLGACARADVLTVLNDVRVEVRAGELRPPDNMIGGVSIGSSNFFVYPFAGVPSLP